MNNGGFQPRVEDCLLQSSFLNTEATCTIHMMTQGRFAPIAQLKNLA